MPRTVLFLFCLALFAHFPLQGQEYIQLLDEPGVNFYDVQRAFEAHWEGRTPEKGSGYKQFKRLEEFWEPRVYPTGYLPDPTIAWREAQRFKERYGGANKTRGASNWTQYMYHDTLSYTSFSAIPGHGRVSCMEVSPLDSNRIFVGTPSGGLWRTVDGGQSWSPLTDDLPVIGVADIVINPVDPQEMYMATGDNVFTHTYSIGILKSKDGGVTWDTTGLSYQVQQNINIRKLLMHPQHTDTVWAATSAGMLRTDDGGANWYAVRPGNWRDVEFKADDNDVLFATTSGGFYKSTDGGATFLPSGLLENNAISRMEIAVSPANPELVYVIAADAANGGLHAFYRSSNAGASFSASANTTNVLGYWPNGGFGGQAWYDMDIAMSPTDSNTVYTGGINIWKTTDGGSSFSRLTEGMNVLSPIYVHGDIHKLEFDGNSLYTACDGGIYRTDDQGTSWEDLSSNLSIHMIYEFTQSPHRDDVVLAGMQDVGSSLYDGDKWTTVTWGDGFHAFFDPNDSLRMYTTAQNGVFFRTTSGPNGFNMFNTGINETSAFRTVLEQDPSNPATFYAGYQNVWKSTNATGSWTRISNLGNSFPLQRVEVAPSNPNAIYATSNWMAYRTTTGGGTWTDITAGLPIGFVTISSLTIDPADHLKIWVTFYGYIAGQKVYFSSDGGNTWTNVTNNLPNLPVNRIALEQGALNGVYAACDVGVYYTNDTLPNWVPFMDGLPNVVVRDLAVMPGIQKIRAGTFGRGVWESDLFVDTLVVGLPDGDRFVGGQLLLYPNPAQSQIAVDFSDFPNFQPRHLQVYASDGRLVLEEQVEVGGQTRIELEVGQLANGMYQAVLSDGVIRHAASFVKGE